MTPTQAVRKVMAQWIEEDHITPQDVNGGMCYEFAQAVAEIVPGAEIVNGEMVFMGDPSADDGVHHFVHHQGKFYDSECPNGVEDYAYLPCIARERHDRIYIWKTRKRSGASMTA